MSARLMPSLAESSKYFRMYLAESSRGSTPSCAARAMILSSTSVKLVTWVTS